MYLYPRLVNMHSINLVASVMPGDFTASFVGWCRWTNARTPLTKTCLFLTSVLAEVLPPTSAPLTSANDDEVKWRQFCSFIGVKPDSKDGPNTTITTVVKKIVSQGIDYPGLAMAARPLQLYVLCIFICGHQFYLGRQVIPSDNYDTDDNLDTLVNVVLRLATHMTTYQLGYDRSACLRNIRTIRLDILSC
ncbi:hypothetical protein C8R48DRAFT_709849 [Suillus tomentosus]|nr:hypothetical protein C8R48DRAFT_709849 [Suillus tomentosus]